MRSFDVLDRHLDIRQNYLLEASAGTGKTFSIENIVVRLLLEKDGLQLEQILVVTFTKASVRDLKTRIRSNIERSYEHLVRGFMPGEGPDFLLKIIEDGPEALDIAKRKLRQALLGFEQSQIYTIHSFCSKMLSENIFESNLRIDCVGDETAITNSFIISIIRDFFRTGIKPEAYSQAQLNLVLKDYAYSMEDLEEALAVQVVKNIEIEEAPSFLSLVDQFHTTMTNLLKKEFQIAEKFIQGFIEHASSFKGIVNQQKRIKNEVMERAHQFADLFSKNSWCAKDLEWLILDQLGLLDLLSLSNAKPKKTPELLHYIEWCQNLRRELIPFVSSAKVFIRMVNDCQKLVKSRLMHEEMLGYDDILTAMKQALDNSNFINKIRTKYQAALVDEFQDTDPVQWNIFSRLFINSGYLYLVGDPKQSIYAFRQADIYTYLQAAEALGTECHASLDTNFRSQSDLVDALNVLFEKASHKGLVDLPRLKSQLDYKKVHFAQKNTEKKLTDECSGIQFFAVEDHRKGSLQMEKLEEEKFFSFISKEIQRLNLDQSIPLNDCAVLVSDRFQADRMAAHFKEWKIPCMKQRANNLMSSKAIPALKEILKSIANPHKESSLKLALGGIIIQWTHEQVRKLNEIEALADASKQFHKFRKTLIERGFSAFFEDLMTSSWHSDRLSIAERLLKQEGGIDFLDELHELVNLILEHECRNQLSPEGFVDYLENFQDYYHEDELTAKVSDIDDDSVKIMTIHASKGLEFSIVFTIGLLKRSKSNFNTMTVCRQNRLQLAAVTDASEEEYVEHCKEVEAEKLRLFYVAMTRAKHRIYCPIIFAPNVKKAGDAEGSPMELFISKLGLSEANYTEFNQFIEQLNVDASCILLENGYESHELWKQEQVPSLVSPQIPFVPERVRFIRSFTSLAQELGKASASSSEKEIAPRDFNNKVKTAHTLPSGSEAGNILHIMLEKLPFENLKHLQEAQELQSFVDSFIANTEFADWNQVFCHILFSAVMAPIIDEFCLADVDPEKMFREIEFMYGASLKESQGYLKGFIDLIFEHNGKYYIIDWKSNWLGNNDADYNNENMAKAVKDNSYDLQADIYKAALERYVSIFDQRPFEEVFGGAYYLFLRGPGVYKVL